MKRYFLGLLGVVLLFPGFVPAQQDILENVGFMVGEFALPQNDGAYVLITDGDAETEYGLDFSAETYSNFGRVESMDIGLCLKWTDVDLATLKQYYEDRLPPGNYLNYLLSAVDPDFDPENGQSPLAVVRINTETNDPSKDVQLCDGAVLNLSPDHDCVPMRIPGDYPNGMYEVSSCNTEDPELSFQVYIVRDVDGDGVTDDSDLCPDSDLADTVIIEGCDSGVANKLFEDGCTISDRIAACASEAENHGEFVSCVTQYTNGLKPLVLSGAQKGAIQSCAAQSSIGVLPCDSCGDDASGLGQNRHRARYELAQNDLVIPCVEIGDGQYFAVDMDLTSATSNNFHFKVKKAEMATQTEMAGIEDPEGTCAQYDLFSNSLTFPSLEIGEKQWRVQMKLLGVNSVNLHFKLEGITEVAP
jgi:hypothetical protein